jgi:hypothetical protein
MIILVIRGVFQSIRFKIFKIEKLAQLLVLSGADRSILYELIGDSFVPSAFSLAMELVFNMERVLIRRCLFDWSNTKEYLWSETNHHLPVSSLNTCKSIYIHSSRTSKRKTSSYFNAALCFQSGNKTNFTYSILTD